MENENITVINSDKIKAIVLIDKEKRREKLCSSYKQYNTNQNRHNNEFLKANTTSNSTV